MKFEQDKNSRIYKPKDDFFVKEDFLVTKILTESRIVNALISRYPKDKFGTYLNAAGKPFDDPHGDLDTTQEISCGYAVVHTLDVKPKNNSLPISQLEFKGYLPNILKNTISVELFNGEYDSIKSKKHSFLLPSQKDIDENPLFYYQRDFKEYEFALEISIYDGNDLNHIVRSVDYDEYHKK